MIYAMYFISLWYIVQFCLLDFVRSSSGFHFFTICLKPIFVVYNKLYIINNVYNKYNNHAHISWHLPSIPYYAFRFLYLAQYFTFNSRTVLYFRFRLFLIVSVILSALLNKSLISFWSCVVEVFSKTSNVLQDSSYLVSEYRFLIRC